MNTSLSHKYVDYKKVKKGIKQQPMETNMKHDQQNQGQTGDSGGEKNCGDDGGELSYSSTSTKQWLQCYCANYENTIKAE